jgi:hypothetical protein
LAALLVQHGYGAVQESITITRLVPREPTADEKLENARRILRADYWSDVKLYADEIREEIASGEITDAEDAYEHLDERVDGAYRVIYTHAAMETVMWSDHDGAYFEEFGPEGAADGDQIEWSRLAYAAFRADILDNLGDLEDLIEELAPLRCDTCDKALLNPDEDARYEVNDDETPYCADCYKERQEDSGAD